MAVSRGLRNNNPGNIRLSATLWQGEVRPSQDKSFCQFKNMAYGYRALIKLLQNYRRLYHCRTIADFIQRWAPPSENNTSGYITRVCREMQVPESYVPDVDDMATMCAFASAISLVEMASLLLWRTLSPDGTSYNYVMYIRMDWNSILTILQDWLAPTGCLAMAIGWYKDRKVYKVRAVKESEGTYKQLYDDLSQTTLALSEQIRKVNEKIINLEQALRKCYQCKYAECCPAVVWMRSGQGEPNNRPLGLSFQDRNRGNNLRVGPDDADEPATASRPPPDDR